MKVTTRSAFTLMAILAVASPAIADDDKLEPRDIIATYAAGGVYCVLADGTKMTYENITKVEVSFYAKMWVYVNGGTSPTGHKGGDHILGLDDTCNFNGARSSPL